MNLLIIRKKYLFVSNFILLLTYKKKTPRVTVEEEKNPIDLSLGD